MKSLPNNFRFRLTEKIHQKKSVVCVGIDPDVTSDQFPRSLLDERQIKLSFAKKIIDEIYDLVPVIKINTRFFSPREWEQLKQIVNYAQKKDLEVIGDCKENDIGNTMSKAYNVQFDEYGFDAITVNGYFGRDGVIGDKNMDIFKKWYEAGKGLFVLIKTSNESGNEIQNIKIRNSEGTGEIYLYQHFANYVENWSEKYDYTIGVVVGATYPEEMGLIRNLISGIILAPGYGTQGGNALAISKAIKKNRYCIVNSSRGVMYAYKNRFKDQFTVEDFAKASRKEVLYMNQDINQYINQFI